MTLCSCTKPTVYCLPGGTWSSTSSSFYLPSFSVNPIHFEACWFKLPFLRYLVYHSQCCIFISFSISSLLSSPSAFPNSSPLTFPPFKHPMPIRLMLLTKANPSSLYPPPAPSHPLSRPQHHHRLLHHNPKTQRSLYVTGTANFAPANTAT